MRHTSPASVRSRAVRFAVLLGLLNTAPVRAETLADAVAAAYARNPVLARQRFRQKEVDENYVQARSQYGPTLSVQADGGYQSERIYNPALAGRQTLNDNNGRFIASVSQPLYTAGRLRGQLASARADVRAGQEQLRQVEQQTVQNVIAVYAAVLRDEARLSVGRENVAVLQDQLRENRARRRVGDVTLTDVGQADARLAAGEAQLANLEAQLAVSRGQYLQIVGNNPGTLAPLPDFGRLPATIDEAFTAAEAANPTLLAAKYTEQSSSANAAAVRGERGPNVSLTGQASYTNRLLRFDGRDGRRELFGGFTITQPLFASGAIQSRVRQADDRNSGDQLGIDVARREALQAVTSAWSQLVASRASLAANERQVSSAQLAFAGMRREALNGFRSTIDTLNAEQELQSAQLNLLQNRYLEYLARAQLLAAIGRLNAALIAPDIAVYDAEAEFRRVRNRGMTPLEPIAMGIDRIGSAAVRRPLSAELTGEGGPRPDRDQALPPTPGPELTQKPLTPITKSRLVPASELPGGMPATAVVGDRPMAPLDPGQ